MNENNVLVSIALAAAILFMTTSPATALEKEDYDFLTTRHLYNLCSAPTDHSDFPTATYACRGFIAGAVQYHNGVSEIDDLPRLICYPSGTTLKDGENAFNVWAEANKENEDLMSELPVKGLLRALSETYPCQKQ
ncbi:Rap1a/Tai family immunity protein [Desulfopila sp. IMCC35008]|uniref:Rap1a/Tai family immunity protein n=1 Tax=Desulfopila sp. IMCC35008 TaxID=2653858 RepID=UPI0013D25276|nr:Rap1a/Tai family immunity protein [Desulfopila sp. IMCC35008]